MTHSIRPLTPGFAVPLNEDHATFAQANEDIDLNEVLKTSMSNIKMEKGQVQAILKVDKLPVVRGRKEEFNLLFMELLNMVFSCPPHNSKILLYIQCVEDTVEEDVMDLSDIKDTFFSIHFHTNIGTSETWLQQNKAKLDESYHNASKISGTLAHYNITKTGCLFSLKLSGKIF